MHRAKILQAEEAVKLKQTGNKALKEKRYDDALKA